MSGQYRRNEAMNHDVRPIALTMLAVAALVGAGCTRSGDRQDLFACQSPDGAKTALFYREMGGGAAGWQDLHVAIRMKDGDEKAVFEMGRGYDVVLEWLSADSLAIHYPEDANVRTSGKQFGVTLSDGHSMTVALHAKQSRLGSFTDDKTRCSGGKELPVSSELRPLK